MADSKTQSIAQALVQLAQSLAPGRREDDSAAAVTTDRQNVDGLAELIRALCPATSATTNAADVATLIRALCPPPPSATGTDLANVARLIQVISPASDEGGRSRLEALVAALSPVEPTARVSALADALARGDVNRLSSRDEQLRSTLLALSQSGTEGGRASTLTAKLSPKERQAAEVFRVLSPASDQPATSVDDAVAFIRALSPASRPADQVAGLIAALCPASDKTVSNVGDAVKFIRALCPAGNVPAADTAVLIRALSPADDRAARRTENVADLVRALCPADSKPATVAELIRALSPADDVESRPVEIAKLIRQLSPANITAVDIIRTLSPVQPGA